MTGTPIPLDAYRLLFENSMDAVLFTKSDGTICAANPAACEMFGMTETELRAAGRAGVVDLDDPRAQSFFQERARTGRARAEFTHKRKDGSTFLAGVSSVITSECEGRAFVIIRDVTPEMVANDALRRNEARQAFLLKLSDALRSLADPLEIQETAAAVLGEHLGVDRAFYTEVVHDEGVEYFVIDREYRTADTSTLIGRYPVESFNEALMREYREGRILAVADIERDTRLTAQQLCAYRAIDIRGYIGVPLNKEGRFVAVLGVHQRTPRSWTPDEVSLMEETAERTWAAVERARAEEAQRQAVDCFERQVRLFDGVASTTPDFVYVFDLQGRFLYANRRLLEVWGMTLPEVIGKTCRDLGYAQWHHDMHMGEIARVIETGRPIKGEVPFEAPLTGVYGVYEYIFTPVLDQNGKVELIAGTTRDVTERKRAEESLQEAHRKKDEFLGMLSHELRNPLAAIRNSIYLLRHCDPDPEGTRRAQEGIERQTDHLTRLVDDLLDVTRIASGRIELQRGRLDLRDVVKEVVEDFGILFGEKGIALAAPLPERELAVLADRTRIVQVLGNLLHNALKFTERGGSVTVALSGTAGRVEVSVRDNGVGIEETLLPTIFEIFVQGERNLDRSEGGLGLGLALVKGITELHGGTVRVASAGPGKGAEFVVSFPLAEEPSVAAGCHSEVAPEQRKQHILVVDDNRDAADSLALIVRVFGHEVEVAYDGPQALESVARRRPHIVLCDVGLPGMSGYEVARKVRTEQGGAVKLVAITGYAGPEYVGAALEAGFDRHLAKPVDMRHLAKILEELS